MCKTLLFPGEMEAHRDLRPATNYTGHARLSTRPRFWSGYFSFCFNIARHPVIIELDSKSSLKLVIVSPGFLRAGRPIVTSVNFDHSAHLVTVEHGYPVVLVSYSGRTAGSTHSFCILPLLAIVI